jgi:excisionase family DNA binding protein
VVHGSPIRLDEYLSLRSAAKQLGITPRFLRKLLHQHGIPVLVLSRKAHRIARSDFYRLLVGATEPPDVQVTRLRAALVRARERIEEVLEAATDRDGFMPLAMARSAIDSALEKSASGP